MKRKPTLHQWLALALSLGTLIAIIGLRQRGGIAVLTQDVELIQLRAERERLAACDDGAVLTARLATQRLSVTPERNGPFPGWSVEPAAAVSSSGTVRRLVRSAPVAWPEIIRVLEAELTGPGARVLSLEIRSRGSRQSREIATVEIVLEHPTETPSRRNPSGGTVFPGAVVPATTPAVGRAPALRRPSAAAEPAAPGPAFAPSRPDPRGPRAGVPPTPNPEKP